MSCAAIQEFAFSLPADSGLLRTSVSAGEPIDQAEVLSLGAMAQSLFVTVTVESRGLDRVDDCRQLWGEAATVFSELCDSWAGIQSDEQSVAWLRERLSHFRELCEDRVSIYSITEIERREFAQAKAFDSTDGYSFGTRSESEPVRELSSLETARINAACQRLGA